MKYPGKYSKPVIRVSSLMQIVCCSITILILATQVSAQTLNTSAWIPNAEVLTTTADANYTYIGGRFTYIGPYTGNGGKFTTSSSTYNPAFPVVEGQVNAVVPDGSGGWYICGAFTKVGGVTRNRLAQIDASGSVTSWNPNANNTVYAIAISGSDVYIGGLFSFVGGQSRNRLAKLNNTTGTADASFNPNANSLVRTVVVSGTAIYTAGDFTSIGGQARNYIAKLNNTNGNADANWKPNANQSVYAIAISGTDIYAGGSFSTIGGQSRNNIAKLNNTTGAADATWNANANSFVYAVAVDGSDIYAGGIFTSIGGATRNRIAKLNNTTGAADATWNANADALVYSIAVSGSDIYAGGGFTSIGGQSRTYIAKLNNTDGSPDANWNVVTGGIVKAIAVNGTDIYVGGDFTSLGGKTQNRIARIDNATGNFDMNWNPGASNSVRAIALSGSKVYVAGDFNAIGGQSRNFIAELDASGNATAWNPHADYFVFALAVSGNTVYAGGAFTTIGGKTRNYVAALDATLNTNNATSWNANSNNAVYALAISGSSLYVGGFYTGIGGQTRNRIAAVDMTTGNATNWNPNANDGIFTLAISGNTVYAGGMFTTIGGQTRNQLAALSMSTGSATAFNAGINGSAVYSIVPSGNILYVAGDFYTIGGSSRPYLAALDATVNTNNILSWNPAVNNTVNTIALSGSKVLAGGNFSSVGTQPWSYLATLSGAGNYWTGTVSDDWNTPGNWSNNAVPSSTDQVIIPSGTPNAPDFNNTTFSVKHFTQLAGQTLDLGSGNMNVSGIFSNNGTITGTGKVVLNGTSAQTISGIGTIANLELNNSNGATISSDTVNITGVLSLTSGTLTTNDRLILKSTSATQTAIVGPVTGAVTGNVVHERYLSAPANTSGGRSWRLLTSPLGNNNTNKSVFYHWQNNGVNDGTGIEVFSAAGTGSNGNGITQGGVTSSLRTYNAATNSYVPVTDTKTQQLFTGSRNNAFLAFVSGPYGSGNITSGSAATNSDATGSLITGTQTYTFTPPNATNIYELIGNPYACPIDFDKVYQNSNTANINRMFWVIDPALGNVGSYVTVTYNNGSYYASAGNQNQYIQTGQAFFVEGNNPGQQSVVEIKESNKETAAPQTNVFRGNNGIAETFRIQLYKQVNNNHSLLDGTLAIFHPNNSNSVDGNDAIKFGNFNESISILKETKNLSIEARAPLQQGDSIKIALSNMQQGNYQLVFEPRNFNTTALAATLYDRLLNAATPLSLSANTTYHFTVTSNTASYLNRFVVVFSNSTVLGLNFLAIQAKPGVGSNEVSWAVSGESGYSRYEIQRSSNGKDFYTIGMQAAAQQNNYRYTDQQPVNGSNYYRVKAISLSSTNVYSAVVHLGNAKTTNKPVTVYPNPVEGNTMQLQLSGVDKGRYFVNIYNAAGQRSVAAQVVYETGTSVSGINIAALPAGIYMMQVISEKGIKISEQKIVRK